MKAALRRVPLQVHEIAATGKVDNRPALVLLHGWGSDSRIWRQVVPLLVASYRVYALDLPGFGSNAAHNYWGDEALLLQAMLEVLPEQAHIAGWSLGGNLALAYAHRHPHRVLSLSLIATNPSFVARDDWPHAMPQESFDRFYQLAQRDTAAALRRFAQLQVMGDPRGRDLARQLRAIMAQDFYYDPPALVDALSWLQSLDQRQLLRQLPMESVFILGDCDQLVPCAFAGGSLTVKTMQATGHIPMQSRPQQLAQLLLWPLSRQRVAVLDKQRIARSFSKAAPAYDGAAGLQRAVGTTLCEMLPQQGSGLGLDLGCGTGFFLPRLQQGNAGLQWLGGDIAEGMLAYIRDQQPPLANRLIAMDAESLPLGDGVLQGVYSNLAVQWCQDLEALFRELRRVLRPGGWVAFSTLLEGTLTELKSSWQQVDNYVHVNQFYSQQAWRQAAQSAGLGIAQWRLQPRREHYRELRQLLRELKALGAHNVNAGMPGGLTGKRSWQQLRYAYEQYRQQDGQLPASWQVLYAVLTHD